MKSIFNVLYCSTSYLLLASQEETLSLLTPTTIFLTSTFLAIVAGLASLIRSDKKTITTRDVVSHTLNMGTCGAALSMLLYVYLEQKPGVDFQIIAIVGILSLMGLPLITFVSDIGKKMVTTIFNTKIEKDQ